MIALSLNGGGAKGYVTALLLKKIHDAFPDKKLYELFDYVSGVSTGSIIGALVATGYSGDEIATKYKTLIPLIFKNKRNILANIFKSSYRNDSFKKLCMEHFDIVYGECKTNFMTYAVRMNTNVISAKFWKSWDGGDKNVKLWPTIMASSAAPTWFDPITIDGVVYIDGGIGCNNPSICIISDIVRNHGPRSIENLTNINISCDYLSGYKDSDKFKGIKDWLTKLPGICLQSGAEVDKYQTDSLLMMGSNIAIQAMVNAPLDSSDFSAMETEAERLWNIYKGVIIEKISKKLKKL